MIDILDDLCYANMESLSNKLFVTTFFVHDVAFRVSTRLPLPLLVGYCWCTALLTLEPSSPPSHPHPRAILTFEPSSLQTNCAPQVVIPSQSRTLTSIFCFPISFIPHTLPNDEFPQHPPRTCSCLSMTEPILSMTDTRISRTLRPLLAGCHWQVAKEFRKRLFFSRQNFLAEP